MLSWGGVSVTYVTEKDFFDKMRNCLIEIFSNIIEENNQILIIEQSFEKQFKSIDNAKDVSLSKLTKPYNTRLQVKDRLVEMSFVVEMYLLEEGVISSADSASEDDSMFQTIENKQVRVNKKSDLSAADFSKVKDNGKMHSANFKKKQMQKGIDK